MRFRQRAPLGILLVLIFCLSVGSENAIGQSTQIDDAQSKLVQAFVLVQQADLEGASPEQISLLANNLNLALDYEDNASKSVSLSNATSAQALSLASAARTQTFLNQAVAYSIAVSAGFGSALFVMEVHRLDNSVRRMRLRRTRLD
ncbi:MAG TPA: hypothetical protein VF944_11450 [Candidatus Bathyarchaeia archaeon]